ncbi:uncharacterized protein LOC135122701 [Zophobas morio]|uniref:uncharacterized protein LOC135122701 n=1 Tax=Zophobas morio TaxID=2755281 RepID=UPI003082EA2A
MSRELNFNEKTILSTPNPIHSSSMAAERKKKIDMSFLNDMPQRFSGGEESLGILSIKSSDTSLLPSALLDVAKQRESECEKARKSMQSFDLKHGQLTSLPSRFLRKSDVSEGSYGGFVRSESTISETDLLPGNCSTPRGSLMKDEFVMRECQLSSSNNRLSQQLNSYAQKLRSGEADTLKVMESIYKEMNTTEGIFQSGADAIAIFEEDEKSWKKEKHIPGIPKEFSLTYNDDMKVSVGSFFIKKSDNIPELFAKSPQKLQAPIPLIETSVCDQGFCLSDDSVRISEIQNIPGDDSVRVSQIQNILSSDESPTNALNKLLKPKRPTKTKSPLRKSLPKSPQKEFSLPKCPIQTSLPNNLDKCGKDITDEAVKENICPDFNQEKSVLSTRSSSALSNLPNGKLPIGTTKTELIWGCVKVGKSSSQEFIVRNNSSSRLGIQCSVSNPSFRLNKEGTELSFLNTIKVVLHPYESRSLTVTFAPTTLGAAVDSLHFSSIDPSHKQSVKQFVKLYGCGGYGNVTIHGIIKDTTGKFLLSLGNVDELQELKQNFVIKNHGSLAAFTYFDLILNGLYAFSNIEIYPLMAVLLPGEEREVVVKYNLQKKDFTYIKSKIGNSCVIDIGKLQVIHGTEVDRARLRKLWQRAKEKNQDFNPYISDLVMKFPGEVIPNDLKYFKESLSCMEEVLKLLNKEEITVTLEQDVDQTLLGQLQDETAMFYSLCENTAVNANNTMCGETCQVEPMRIILTPPDKIKDRIFLTNNSKKTLYFEVASTPESLYLKPKSGTIYSDETQIIELTYVKKCNDKTVFKVTILVDNESFEVDVKVVFVKM